jgi:hypothetical protein
MRLLFSLKHGALLPGCLKDFKSRKIPPLYAKNETGAGMVRLPCYFKVQAFQTVRRSDWHEGIILLYASLKS